MILIGLTFAILLSLAGLYAIRLAWLSRELATGKMLITGWTCLLIGHCLAYITYRDAGVAICCMFALILACVLVLQTNRGRLFRGQSKRKTAPYRSQIKQSHDAVSGGHTRRLRGVLVTLLAGPGAIGAAMMGALLLYRLLALSGASPANSIVTAFFVFPVLAAAFSAYSLIDRACLRRVATCFGCLTLMGVLLVSSGGLN